MPRLRPLASRALLLLAGLALAGCIAIVDGKTLESTAPSHAGSEGLERIVDRGALVVGLSGEQPPLNMTTREGELIGLEVALARTLAGSMGVEARFEVIPFPGLLDALEAGVVDLVMSGMTITPRRNLRVSFVGPYFVSGKSILTKSDTLLAIRSPEDLNLADFRFAALRGSTSQEFVEVLLPEAQLVTTESLDQAVRMVIDDEVSALVADIETCAYALLRHPEAGLAALRTRLTTEPIGIALRADDTLLANLLDNYLAALDGTGALEDARLYWFEDPSWVRELR